MGMTIPEEYGGGGTDTLSYAIAVEELTRIDSSVAITVAAHHSLGTLPIYLFGTEEQKQQWLPELASGRKLAAFGLTEPDAGSDAGATRTTARLEDGEWVIDGSKIFITNAGTDITACVTITARHRRGGDLEPDRPERHARLRRSREPMQKLGWRASDTRELSFQGVRVPEENLLGARGEGLQQFLKILDGGRISVAAMGVGLAQGCYDLALAYASERNAVRQADRARSRPCSRSSSTWRPRSRRPACSSTAPRGRRTRGATSRRTAAMAKLYSGELSHRAANWALQIHGGYGFMDEYADLAALPRPEDPRDRRGHERGPADGHRAPPRTAAAGLSHSCCSGSSSTTISAAARTSSATPTRARRSCRSRIRDRAVPRGRRPRGRADHAGARDAHPRRPPLGPRAPRARARPARLDPPAGATRVPVRRARRRSAAARRVGGGACRAHAGPPARALRVRRRGRARPDAATRCSSATRRGPTSRSTRAKARPTCTAPFAASPSFPRLSWSTRDTSPVRSAART